MYPYLSMSLFFFSSRTLFLINCAWSFLTLEGQLSYLCFGICAGLFCSVLVFSVLIASITVVSFNFSLNSPQRSSEGLRWILHAGFSLLFILYYQQLARFQVYMPTNPVLLFSITMIPQDISYISQLYTLSNICFCIEAVRHTYRRICFPYCLRGF